jgi:hypothetical protein
MYSCTVHTPALFLRRFRLAEPRGGEKKDIEMDGENKRRSMEGDFPALAGLELLHVSSQMHCTVQLSASTCDTCSGTQSTGLKTCSGLSPLISTAVTTHHSPLTTHHSPLTTHHTTISSSEFKSLEAFRVSSFPHTADRPYKYSTVRTVLEYWPTGLGRSGA